MLAQAQSVSRSLLEQRRIFGNVQDKLVTVGERFPAINGLMNAIRRKKSKVWRAFDVWRGCLLNGAACGPAVTHSLRAGKCAEQRCVGFVLTAVWCRTRSCCQPSSRPAWCSRCCTSSQSGGDIMMAVCGTAEEEEQQQQQGACVVECFLSIPPPLHPAKGGWCVHSWVLSALALTGRRCGVLWLRSGCGGSRERAAVERVSH
jgi:hypothetical protein